MSTTASEQRKSLLFYPTSPVHIRNLSLIAERLTDWRILCIISAVAARLSPGIIEASEHCGFEKIVVEHIDQLSLSVGNAGTVVMLGAAFEPFALELFVWAKSRGLPVVAVEEVAQLSLNNCQLNNYDLPLDMFFVANEMERDLFLQAGFREESLVVSGLLSWDQFAVAHDRGGIREKLGIIGKKKLLVYTTSPLRSRLAIHNKDDRKFRHSILEALSHPEVLTSWDVVVKLHPNENLGDEARRIHEISPHFTVVGREVETLDLLVAADAVMNRGNSETILDAVVLGRPAIVVACGIKTIFHACGGALIVEDQGRIQFALEAVAKSGQPDKKIMRKVFDLPSEGVASCIARHLNSLVGQNHALTSERLEWLVKSYLFLGMMDKLPQVFRFWSDRTPLLESIEQAVSCHLGGNITRATDNWQVAARLAPDWYYPRYELAHGYLAIHEWQSAFHHAEDAIDLHPPHHFLWHEIPMEVVKTTALRGMDRIEEALSVAVLFDEKRGVFEDMPELLIERAAILFRLHRNDAALDLVEQSRKLLVTYPLWPHIDSLFYHRIGLLLRDMGETRQAFDCFYKALELLPDSYWTKYEIAVLNENYAAAAEMLAEIVANPSLAPNQRVEIESMLKEANIRKGVIWRMKNRIRTFLRRAIP